MKWMLVFSILLLISCDKKSKTVPQPEVNVAVTDTVDKKSVDTIPTKKYQNARFREVTVEKVTAEKFRVKGEGQIFEANFNWVVEDGHNELKSGFQMTDAGAPEWGKFNFLFQVAKPKENSTLTLILFEISAEDGSRQHELPITLP